MDRSCNLRCLEMFKITSVIDSYLVNSKSRSKVSWHSVPGCTVRHRLIALLIENIEPNMIAGIEIANCAGPARQGIDCTKMLLAEREYGKIFC